MSIAAQAVADEYGIEALIDDLPRMHVKPSIVRCEADAAHFFRTVESVLEQEGYELMPKRNVPIPRVLLNAHTGHALAIAQTPDGMYAMGDWGMHSENVDYLRTDFLIARKHVRDFESKRTPVRTACASVFLAAVGAAVGMQHPELAAGILEHIAHASHSAESVLAAACGTLIGPAAYGVASLVARPFRVLGVSTDVYDIEYEKGTTCFGLQDQVLQDAVEKATLQEAFYRTR